MNLTLMVIILIVVVIAVFDVWVIWKKGKKESISAWIIRLSHKYPSVPFLLGFVCGHLFWSMDTADWKIEEKAKEVKESVIEVGK